MNENASIRELLEAVLRKLEDSRVEQSSTERTSAAPPSTEPIASHSASHSASHPGLERFTIIESEQSAPGQKACYMEPDRPCVKSGACEMRGY